MTTKFPLISLDRPNNTSAIQSLETAEPALLSATADIPTAADETSPAHDSGTRVNGAHKPAARTPKAQAVASAPQVAPQLVQSEAVQPAAFEKVVSLGARIPASLHQSIKLYSVAHGIDLQQFVQEALTEHLKRLQGE